MNKRRTFLGYLTSTALLPLLPVRAAAAPRLPDGADTALIGMLQEIVPDNAATHRLGTTARRKFGDAYVAEIIPGRLFASLMETPTQTPDALRANLQSLRDADFAAGDTVTLKGWILARSEAEAIALVSLHRTA